MIRALPRRVELDGKEITFVFRTVPHWRQRYETPGDWIPPKKEGDPFQIVASGMKNKKYEYLTHVHEFVECLLCWARGITDEVVVAHDLRDLEKRKKKEPLHFDEPGNDPAAPYHEEHVAATCDEMLAAKEIGVVWEEYDKTVKSLSRPWYATGLNYLVSAASWLRDKVNV